MDEILNWGTHISSTSPYVLYESDFFWIDLELLSEPSVVEFNTFLFEENVIIRFVEDMNSQHDKAWIMSPGQTDIIQVVESHTENGLDGWIFWRVELSCYTIGLEAVDTCCDVFDIISPSGNDWISCHSLAWNSCGCQGFFKSIPSTFVCKFFSLKSDTASFSNESVLTLATEVK